MAWKPTISEVKAGRLSVKSLEYFRAINTELLDRDDEAVRLNDLDLDWWEYDHTDRDYFYGY